MCANQGSIGQSTVSYNLLRSAVIVLVLFRENVRFEGALLRIAFKFILLGALVSSDFRLVEVLLDIRLLLLLRSRRHAALLGTVHRADRPHFAGKVDIARAV